jgi:hypothetical protein
VEKAIIAATAITALLLPIVAPRDAAAIGLLLPAVQKVSESGFRTPAQPGTYGFAFDVLAPFRVDALGIAAGGTPDTGTVTIWDSGFHLVVAVDIPPVLPAEQFSFHWIEVKPTTLRPGSYVIGASYTPGGPLPFDVEGRTIPHIRWREGRQGIGEGALPRAATDEFGPLGVLWANFATVVPEPASWGLLIAGLGAVGLALRRRGRAAARGASHG